MRRLIVTAVASALIVTGCAATRGGHRTDGGTDPGHRAVGGRRPATLAAAWSASLAGGPGGMAADRSGAVVAVDNRSVVALDPHGGRRWSASVPGAGLGWPALGRASVIVPTLRDDGGPGGCVALHRERGARMWAYEEPDSQGVAVVRAGRLVICALADGVLVAIDAATGARRWRSVLAPSAPRAAVSIPERTALAVDASASLLILPARIGSHWIVAMVDLRTGADRGAFDFGALGPMSAPVSIGPRMLAVGLSKSREVCSLDLRRRRVGPCVAVPVPSGFDPSSIPVVADGLFVIAGGDGSLTAVDLAARKVRWSVRGPSPILGAHPAVVDGVVMVSDWTRVAWAVRLADGSAVEVPTGRGWVVAVVADADGFDVAKRSMLGGWIERWVPVP